MTSGASELRGFEAMRPLGTVAHQLEGTMYFLEPGGDERVAKAWVERAREPSLGLFGSAEVLSVLEGQDFSARNGKPRTRLD